MKNTALTIIRRILLRMGWAHRKVILSLLEENKFARVLDCGCGSGEFAIDIGKRIGTDNLYGIEVSEYFAQRAESNGIKVYRADLNHQFPFKDNTFDVVLGNRVIEHLYNTDLFVKEIYRVLKPGGYAVLQAPNLAALHSIVFLIFGWQPFMSNISDEVAATEFQRLFMGPSGKPGLPHEDASHYHWHQRLFTRGAFKRLFEYHGFKVEKVVGSGYWPLWGKVSQLACLIDPAHSAELTIKLRKVTEREDLR